MPPQYVADRLVGDIVAEISQRAGDPVISQPEFSRANLTTSASTSGEMRGRPGYERCFDRSNFAAINRRYQARIVSGLATQATCARALRPSLFPISASVSRSGSDSRRYEGRCDRRIRFSAARYSLCSKSSWLTSPVT